MFFPALLTFSSVLLASNASVLFSDIDGTATFKSFSFTAVPTSIADKESLSDNHTLVNDANMQYIGKVNVAGHDFNLQIDTGSSDLYVISGEKLKVNKTTTTTVNLTYGLGSAYGNIAYAPVSFGGYEVDNQAFLNVTNATDQDGEGLIGIGLNGLNELERTTKNGSAQSVMANLFAQYPSLPHFMGLALERTEDGEGTAGGYISIGEYDPQFRNVTSMPKNLVTPTSASRWTIAMDAMTVNGKQYPLKSGVQGTAKGKAIALIDSGTSLAYIPSDAVNAIYSQFSGSVHVKTTSEDAWYVPCLEQANLSFAFTNVAYPVNPMELSSPMKVTHHNKQYTVCINAFQPGLNGFEHEVDFLLGDIFMRNVYSIFNFGNGSTTHGDSNADADGASIQFLSRTDRDLVYADFPNRRKHVLEGYPPLFDLTQLHSNGSTDGGGMLQSAR